MAEGTQNMTTYNARTVTASNSAANPDGALLLSGDNRLDDSTGDTWIYYDSLSPENKPYGIKHDQKNNKLLLYGNGNDTSWTTLNTGDTYIEGKVGINYNPETEGNTYQLYIKGTTYGTSTITSYTNFETARKGYGLYLIDKAGVKYAGIYDNGTNLWIGATSSGGAHHKGNTYISTGHNGTAGYKCLYVSIPTFTNGAISGHTSRVVTTGTGGSNAQPVYIDSNGYVQTALAYADLLTDVSWSDGNDAGPTVSVTVGGTTKTATIPSATDSISGTVTTVDQTFAGNKTFKGSLYPQAKNTYSLGKNEFNWKELFLSTQKTANSVGLQYTNGTDILARIGVNNSGQLGIYTSGNIYIRPSMSATDVGFIINTDKTIVEGGAGATHSLGTAAKHWLHGYFNDLYISESTKYTTYNSKFAGTHIAPGYLYLTETAPKISLYRATGNAVTGGIASDATGGLHLTGTAATEGTIYKNRTIKPIVKIDGLTYVTTNLETGGYFLNNTDGGSNTGYYLYANAVSCGRMYVSKKGTAAVATTVDDVITYSNTTGETILQLGNDKQGTSGNSASVVDNSRGRLRLYGAGTSYIDLVPSSVDTNGPYTNYLPQITGYSVTTGSTVALTMGEWTVKNWNRYSDSYIPITNSQGSAGITDACRARVRLYAAAASNGYAYIDLGNNIPRGSAANANGGLRLYGTSTYYSNLITNQKTVNNTVYLPNYDGDAYVVHTGSTAKVGSASQPVYIEANGRVTAITGTIANSTTGNAGSATKLETARSLWGNSFNGTADISGNITIKNNNNRYHDITIYQHNTDNIVALLRYDSGNKTNVTSGRWYIYQYSPNTTATTASTGHWERYRLPLVDTALEEDKTYEIRTSKSNAYNLTGNVTGNLTGNVTGNVTGNLTGNVTGNASTASKMGSAASWLYFHHSNELNFGGTYADSANIYFGYRAVDSRPKPTLYIFGSGNGTAEVKASKVYSAVWNDFAEFRKVDIEEPGYVVVPQANGMATKSTKRLQAGGRIISDTFGCAVGESTTAKTPLGMAGRVLAYPYRPLSYYHIGDCVCTAPNGTVDVMTREEIKEYPDRILGIVNEIPTYDVWKQQLINHDPTIPESEMTKQIKVKGRIWIDIK